ncbi:hypothetical protein HA50_12320 [Pantoea cypripedii]|uniref:Uncharacterized protein n=1 Tax=Pantoea cypripedii TaxID=55209 RepID=A0A1X1EVP2_PANCY|nr:hypothetical protein HA50_12320 [Pantoea cypripedii]
MRQIQSVIRYGFKLFDTLHIDAGDACIIKGIVNNGSFLGEKGFKITLTITIDKPSTLGLRENIEVIIQVDR